MEPHPHPVTEQEWKDEQLVEQLKLLVEQLKLLVERLKLLVEAQGG